MYLAMEEEGGSNSCVVVADLCPGDLLRTAGSKGGTFITSNMEIRGSVMKKFMNKPEAYVDEMLRGLYLAHADKVSYINDDLRCLVKAGENRQGKVALATGGGSGHLPLFLGYVGEGMLDGCAIGGVFQSPSAEQMYELTKAIDSGAGTLYIYGNYSGDIINFEMAAEMAEMDDIRVLNLTGKDDVASKKKGEEDKRRGVAGIFFVYKCAGAAADAMLPLDEVMRVAEKAVANVRTMGVAFTPCVIPEAGRPSFSLEEDEMGDRNGHSW